MDGHLTMLVGYMGFFMEPALASTYLCLKKELDQLTERKLENPKLNTSIYDELLTIISYLISQDHCHGQFVHLNQLPTSSGKPKKDNTKSTSACGDSPKSRVGHQPLSHKTKTLT